MAATFAYVSADASRDTSTDVYGYVFAFNSVHPLHCVTKILVDGIFQLIPLY